MDNVSDNSLASFLEGASTIAESEEIIKSVQSKDDLDFFLITSNLQSKMDDMGSRLD